MEWDLGVCAFVSDIHGNKHALDAVFDDLSKERIDRVICLGDMVGYGANPLECVSLVRERCDFSIVGNHDDAVMFDPEYFNPAAAAAVYWTRNLIEKSPECEDIYQYLGNLERWIERGDVLLVHGSPRKPLEEYVFPDDAWNSRKMGGCFDKVKHLSFQGHTHMPGIFVNGLDYQFIESSEIGYTPFKFDEHLKYMINVGSVGQPRDKDPRACYAIFDGETCRYRRVEYDVEGAVREIRAVKELEDFPKLAFRLRDGE